MALNASGVSSVSIADVAAQEIQNMLTAKAVILPTILDISSQVMDGQTSVAIPYISGLAAGDTPDDGSESADGGMAIGASVLNLNKNREVTAFIYDSARAKSTVDLDEAFLNNAPGVYAEDVEATLYLELDGASASNPDHVLQMSGASNLVPTLADIRLAAKLLDDQNVPQEDRHIVMPTSIKHAINAFAEVVDASKFGSSDAIQKGYLGQLYGFNLWCTTKATANTMIGYHKTALAFAAQKQVTYEEERQSSKARDFKAIRGIYGCKVLDSGKRCILFNATGS